MIPHPVAAAINGCIGLALGIAGSLCASLVHFEVLHRLTLAQRRRMANPRASLILTIGLLLVAHVVEIGLHAGVFRIAISLFHLGRFLGPAAQPVPSLFYLSAEVYSSLGYSDVVPTGQLRILVAVTALNGIVLLAWSGSFLFALTQRYHDRAVK